jgi:hypothetical protein
VLAWLHVSGAAVRAALRGIAHHTGLPVVVVAAIVLVASWRILRHGLSLAVEVAVAVALLLAATHLGWIRW